MLITVFGSTGQTGQQIVSQALGRGYRVRAFGRNVFTTDFPDHPNLERFKGALFDEKDVSDAIVGTDVVLSAIGGSFDGTDKARSLGIRTITEQMKKMGIHRIIAVGGKGQLDAGNGKLYMESPEFPDIYLPVSREHLKALEMLQASGLQWTFVCCPNIVPGEPSGLYHTARNNAPVPDSNQITTGNLATFMLDEIEKKEYLCCKTGISNG